MAKRRITKTDLSAIEAEYAKWKEICNGVVGVIAFTLAVASLGTPCPSVWAWASSVFVVLLMGHMQVHFPKIIRALRESELAELDQLVLQGIEKKYFNLRAAVTSFNVYLFGWIFLVFVAIGGSWFSEGCTF